MTTKALGNQRLLDLATYVARRQSHIKSATYNQRRIVHDCGSPACLIGHEAVRGNLPGFKIERLPAMA